MLRDSDHKSIFLALSPWLLMGFGIPMVFFSISNKQNADKKYENIIEFTKQGFLLERLIIRREETVQFVNKSNKPFWLASNLHPGHEAY